MLKKKIFLILTAAGLSLFPITQETEFLVRVISVLSSLF